MSETKRKRGRPNKPIQALPEKNRDLYRSFMFTEPVDLFDPAAVEERTQQYIDYVNQNDIAPLWQDYAFCLGFHRSYLGDVMRGTSRTAHPIRTRQILESVHLWLEASLAQFGLQHPENSIMVIWLQKNNFNYHEPTLSIQLDNQSLVEDRSRDADAIRKRLEFIQASVVPVTYDEPEKKLVER